jgi:RNA-binding protein YlmH
MWRFPISAAHSHCVVHVVRLYLASYIFGDIVWADLSQIQCMTSRKLQLWDAATLSTPVCHAVLLSHTNFLNYRVGVYITVYWPCSSHMYITFQV